MQNTKAAGVRLRPLLAYSLRSLRGDRNGNGEGGKDNSSRNGLNLDPSSQLCLGLLVFLRSQTCHGELGKLTRQ